MRMHLALALLLAPATAFAQAGTTQGRAGLGTGSHPNNPVNSMPAGTENATSGPQSRPAYPSGSTAANPGAAFVRNQPRPATGTGASPPGTLSTTKVGPGGAITRPGGPAGQEGAAPLPPK